MELIPDDIDSLDVPPGERNFHLFLNTIFSDSPDVLGWHGVRVAGKEIDFALLIPNLGLFIFEVKDWLLGSILETGPDTFLVHTRCREERMTSPYVQARECFFAARNAIQKEPSLCHGTGKFQGKPILPVTPLVVFANIGREESRESPHAERFSESSTLFLDDLQSEGPYLSGGPQGATYFQSFLSRAMSVVFSVPPLAGLPMEALKKKVFRDSVIRTSPRPTKGKLAPRKIGVLALDHSQEQYARAIGKGPRLLKGMAGSGKTLVLAYRAIYKARFDPSARRILFTCYNLSLAKYVGELIRRNVPKDRRARVTVKPFYDLCGEVLGEPVEHEGRDTPYYDEIVSRVMELVKEYPESKKFDVLLIDEAQDFSPEMVAAVRAMLRKDSEEVMVAVDAEQDIYGRFSPKSLGVDFRGRTHILPHSYRCTQQIFDFSHRITGKALPESVDKETGQLLCFPHQSGRNGPEPDLQVFNDTATLIDTLVADVRRLIKVEEVPPAEIGILYPSRWYMQQAAGSSKDRNNPSGILPLLIMDAFLSTGISVTWVSENSASKRSFALHSPSVKVCTVHSAKGLDFETVFIVDTSGLPLSELLGGRKQEGIDQRYRNLLFVGCTRARDRLHIFSLRA